METEQVYREYFNDPQLYSLAMNTRDEVIVAGRGMGKGAIQAGRLMSCFQGMRWADLSRRRSNVV